VGVLVVLAVGEAVDPHEASTTATTITTVRSFCSFTGHALGCA
jgi:hypothetical protein